MRIFIDESGNLGSSGRFFVIAALVPNNLKRIKNLVRNCCTEFASQGVPALKELKAYDLKFPQKQNFLNRLIRFDDFTCSYIVADKKHIETRVMQDKNICYNYLSSHLLKPILKGATEDIEIFFDNHTTKVASTNSLAEYIKLQAYTTWGVQHNVEVHYCDSHRMYCLQAIDIIANSINSKYNYNHPHFYTLLESKFNHRVRFPSQKFNKQ